MTHCVQDLGQFYAFCLVVHLCIFLASALWHHNINGYTSRSTLSRVVNTFIAAAPIGCPTVVAFANAACVMKLRKAGVHVLSRAKLRAAAAVTTVCFDKTGTLTGSVVRDLLTSSCCDFMQLMAAAALWFSCATAPHVFVCTMPLLC